MKKLLSVLALFALCSAPSYAQNTKAQMTTEINTNFPNNTTGQITPAILRATTTDLVNSYQQAPTVNAQTGTSYTIVVGDYGKLVTFSNAAAIAVTLPQATGSFLTFNFYVANVGAGTVTITPTTSTINGAATLTLVQNQAVWVVSDGTNYKIMNAPPYAGGLTITPPANTVNLRGLLITQSTSGIGATSAFGFNTINLQDNGYQGASSPAVGAFEVNLTLGAGGTWGGSGGRRAIYGLTYMKGDSAFASGLKEYVGIVGQAIAEDADGGTSVLAQGAIYASNYTASLLPTAYHFENITGAEFNYDNRVTIDGSAVNARPNRISGINIVSEATHICCAKLYEGAIVVGAKDGSQGITYGLMFSSQYNDDVGGTAPITSTGSLIATQGSWTVDKAIDISSITTTTCAFKQPGQCTISGTGAIIPGSGTFATNVGKIYTSIGGGGTGLTISAAQNAAGTYDLQIVNIGGTNLIGNPQGTANLLLGSVGAATAVVGRVAIASNNANAFAVGRLGATTPAFNVDASTATSITGVQVKSAAASGGVDLTAIGETNVAVRINGAGSGTITIGGVSTGSTIIGDFTHSVPTLFQSNLNGTAPTIDTGYAIGLNYTAAAAETAFFNTQSSATESFHWYQIIAGPTVRKLAMLNTTGSLHLYGTSATVQTTLQAHTASSSGYVGTVTNHPLQVLTNNTVVASFVGGLQVGLTGADQGTGTINVLTRYYVNSTAGATATVSVRKGDDSGSCNLVFTGGLYTSTTC